MMRAERRKVAPPERIRASEDVCRRILDRADVKAAMAAKESFAVYLASPSELELSVLVERLWAAGCQVLVPAWRGGEYKLAPYSRNTELVPGPMGILEPAELPDHCCADVRQPAVWIVPGLAFTKGGTRLGYGGGWYDRMMSAAPRSVVLLGVAYPFQIVDGLPAEPHDVTLSDVVVAGGAA